MSHFWLERSLLLTVRVSLVSASQTEQSGRRSSSPHDRHRMTKEPTLGSALLKHQHPPAPRLLPNICLPLKIFAGLSKHLPVFLLGTENAMGVGGDSGSCL